MLKIKGKQEEKTNAIELVTGVGSFTEDVLVKIDGEIICRFKPCGEFQFYGQGADCEYEGTWQ